MALPHARPGQAIDLQPLGSALAASASHAILKADALELIRLVLREGKSVPAHRTPGESTLLCLEGRLAIEGAAGSVELAAGQLVLLAAGSEHSIHALEDASALLTIQLPAGAPGSDSTTL